MVFPLLLPQDHHPEGIHHPGDIDPLGTPRRALKTGGAEPERIHVKDLLLQPEQGISNDGMGPHLHGKGHRAPGCAIPALVAGEEILPADQFDLLRKFVVDLVSRQLDFHGSSPLFLIRTLHRRATVAIIYPTAKRACVPRI
jgi:hypothetical protein